MPVNIPTGTATFLVKVKLSDAQQGHAKRRLLRPSILGPNPEHSPAPELGQNLY